MTVLTRFLTATTFVLVLGSMALSLNGLSQMPGTETVLTSDYLTYQP